MNRVKFFLGNRLLIVIVSLLLLLGTLSFVLIGLAAKPEQTQEPLKDVPIGTNNSPIVTSAYPQDLEFPPTKPPLDDNLSAIIEKGDAVLETGHFANLKSNPQSMGMRSTIYSPQEIPNTSNVPKDIPSLWLDKDQAFEGYWLSEIYFPEKDRKTQKLTLKALLDEKEIDFSVDSGEMSSTFIAEQTRGERKLYKLKTLPIPPGVHTLRFLFFFITEDINLNSGVRSGLERRLGGQSFIVYAGEQLNFPKITYQDWSVSRAIFPGLNNFFELNDGTLKKDVFPMWTPTAFTASQEVSYVWMISNPEPQDREYCVIAFLDYKQIAFGKDQLKKCGIVKGGYQARFKETFQVPSQPGMHTYQLIQIENPEAKLNYFKALQVEAGGGVTASSRIVLNLK